MHIYATQQSQSEQNVFNQVNAVLIQVFSINTLVVSLSPSGTHVPLLGASASLGPLPRNPHTLSAVPPSQVVPLDSFLVLPLLQNGRLSALIRALWSFSSHGILCRIFCLLQQVHSLLLNSPIVARNTKKLILSFVENGN